jgi:hypothetical protein
MIHGVTGYSKQIEGKLIGECDCTAVVDFLYTERQDEEALTFEGRDSGDQLVHATSALKVVSDLSVPCDVH